MNRTFAIGDIHGAARALKQLITRIVPQKDDQFIFLGDYVDGWSQSFEVLEQLIAIEKKHTCIFIKGNHDLFLEDWLRTGYKDEVWLLHGGLATLASYSTTTASEKLAHLNFIERMPMYHIDIANRLFVHAGFTSMHGVEKEYNSNTLSWDRTLWEAAHSLNPKLNTSSLFYPKRLKLYSEIFIGHTPLTNYRITEPFNAANLWNVDTGAAFTGKLTALEVNSKTVFQSDTVQSLYPDEKGRNR